MASTAYLTNQIKKAEQREAQAFLNSLTSAQRIKLENDFFDSDFCKLGTQEELSRYIYYICVACIF